MLDEIYDALIEDCNSVPRANSILLTIVGSDMSFTLRGFCAEILAECVRVDSESQSQYVEAIGGLLDSIRIPAYRIALAYSLRRTENAKKAVKLLNAMKSEYHDVLETVALVDSRLQKLSSDAVAIGLVKSVYRHGAPYTYALNRLEIESTVELARLEVSTFGVREPVMEDKPFKWEVASVFVTITKLSDTPRLKKGMHQNKQGTSGVFSKSTLRYANSVLDADIPPQDSRHEWEVYISDVPTRSKDWINYTLNLYRAVN